jgi:hypothetical protein
MQASMQSLNKKNEFVIKSVSTKKLDCQETENLSYENICSEFMNDFSQEISELRSNTLKEHLETERDS